MGKDNEAFRRVLEEAIGADNASIAFSALDRPASVSVRLNPSKNFALFPDSTPVPWSEYGRILPERPVFTLDPLFHAGAYYVQDSSSMYVGHVLRKILKTKASDRPLKVLDLCAAPGGKTTDVAASLRQKFGYNFILVANEVMKNRVTILSENVALWGDPNIVVTSADPAGFASLEGWFDIILADVPCSGEGMFRKDPDAVAMWSEDNVKYCASRQRRIIADVWPALAPGGALIYSTCTFNRHENDDNVAWIAAELGADIAGQEYCDAQEGILRTEHGCSLVPGFVLGEGQYCSVLIKNGGTQGSMKQGRPAAVLPEAKALESFFRTEVVFRKKGDLIKAVPKAIETEVNIIENAMRVVSSGCAAGMFKGKDFVPDADLALTNILADNAFPHLELDKDRALAFLRKENLPPVEAEKGYLIVTYNGCRLGFIKNIGNRVNNLHPQGRRIRMV